MVIRRKDGKKTRKGGQRERDRMIYIFTIVILMIIIRESTHNTLNSTGTLIRHMKEVTVKVQLMLFEQ